MSSHSPAGVEVPPGAPAAAPTGPGARDVVVIEPRPGWRALDLRELARYRDLLYFMTWRGIKARYAQSALGVGWAVIQPVMMMLVFTVIFGRVAEIRSDGSPYALMAFCGVVPWTFFSNAVTFAATSLTQNAPMISKVYFPRAILPMSAIASRFVDLAISLLLLAAVLAWFGAAPRPSAAALIPALVGIMALAALGLGLWLSAMAVQYRDVAYGLTFAVQLLMYLSPVVYPVSLVPARFLPLYGLNPMAGVIAGFRAALIGGGPPPWGLILEAAAVSAALAVSGMYYFRRMERTFADVA